MTLWGRSGCEFTAGEPCWLGKLQQTTQRTLSLPRHSRVDRASASLFHGFWISPPTKNGWAGTPSTCWCGFSPDHPFVLCCPLVLLSSLRLRIFFFFAVGADFTCSHDDCVSLCVYIFQDVDNPLASNLTTKPIRVTSSAALCLLNFVLLFLAMDCLFVLILCSSLPSCHRSCSVSNIFSSIEGVNATWTDLPVIFLDSTNPLEFTCNNPSTGW